MLLQPCFAFRLLLPLLSPTSVVADNERLHAWDQWVYAAMHRTMHRTMHAAHRCMLHRELTVGMASRSHDCWPTHLACSTAQVQAEQMSNEELRFRLETLQVVWATLQPCQLSGLQRSDSIAWKRHGIQCRSANALTLPSRRAKARKLNSIGRRVDTLLFGWHSNKRAAVMQDGYMQLRGAIRDKKTGAAKQGE